jgi:acetyl esterase/lipase
MHPLHRREFLGLGGALLATGALAQDGQPAGTPSRSAPAAALPNSWINAPTVPLWPGEPPGAAGFSPQPLPSDWPAVLLRNVAKPELRVFRPVRANGHGLLVIPGGSYCFVSVVNEGAEVAARMTALGMTVFVLTYRLPGEGSEKRSDVPLQDAQRAMRLIRSNAARFAIEPNKVSVVGFSAGGHLAATLATQHAEPTYAGVDAADGMSARPFAAGLVYPVITMEKPWTHEMSRNLLLGEHPTDPEVERRSAERQVSSTTPPIFTVHAIDDYAVPVENSVNLMNAMREAKRPVEAHFLQEGGHAFGVGHSGTPSEHWISLFSSWLGRTASLG